MTGGIPGANLGCPSGGDTCVAGAYSCGLVSTLMLGGYWSLGDRGYTPFQGGTNIFSFADSLDLVRGKHHIAVGIGIRANQMNVGAEAFQDGFWIPGAIGTFSGFSNTPSNTTPNITASIPGSFPADVLLGLLGVSEHDQTYNGPVTGRRWKIFRPFVNDDWRITKDLTLNLGFAYNMTTPISEEHGRQADFIPTTGQLLVANQGGVNSSAGVNMDWTGYEPRIGLAYKLLGSDKTVVRAAFGIFHDSAWSMGAQGLWQNPPFFAESDQFGLAQNSGITFASNLGVGCPSGSAYCATASQPTPSGSYGYAVTGVSMSSSFIPYPTPPTLSTLTGKMFNQETNF